MERCLIGVGANLDPEENIAEGLLLLARRVRILAVSPFYVTAPIGRPEQPDYLNGVVVVEHGDGPAALRDGILRPVEAARGRARTADAYAARTLDLDVLLYGDRTGHVAGMTLPDPHLWSAPFWPRPRWPCFPDWWSPARGGRSGNWPTPPLLRRAGGRTRLPNDSGRCLNDES